MILFVTVVVALLGAVVSHPHHTNLSYAPISEADRAFLRTLPSHRGSYPAGFKEAYVGRDGSVVHGYRPSGEYIKVIGSPQASLKAVELVAEDIHKMLRFSPPQIFSKLAAVDSGMGVFRKEEKLTIFPEYARLKDTPECRGRCDGSCSVTCTFDGRKWETVAGIGGSLGLVQEANVMCVHDPYYNHYSVAVHEFAHVVDGYGFDRTMRKMRDDAYANAKENVLWRLEDYSMANAAEYFGQASGAFFLVNIQGNSGGMNECYGRRHYCRTESAMRHHIQQFDPKLYDLLSYVYTSRHPYEPSGLTICPSDSTIG